MNKCFNYVKGFLLNLSFVKKNKLLKFISSTPSLKWKNPNFFIFPKKRDVSKLFSCLYLLPLFTVYKCNLWKILCLSVEYIVSCVVARNVDCLLFSYWQNSCTDKDMSRFGLKESINVYTYKPILRPLTHQIIDTIPLSRKSNPSYGINFENFFSSQLLLCKKHNVIWLLC